MPTEAKAKTDAKVGKKRVQVRRWHWLLTACSFRDGGCIVVAYLPRGVGMCLLIVISLSPFDSRSERFLRQ